MKRCCNVMRPIGQYGRLCYPTMGVNPQSANGCGAQWSHLGGSDCTAAIVRLRLLFLVSAFPFLLLLNAQPSVYLFCHLKAFGELPASQRVRRWSVTCFIECVRHTLRLSVRHLFIRIGRGCKIEKSITFASSFHKRKLNCHRTLSSTSLGVLSLKK